MATVVALLLRALVIQPFSVPSGAMAPTLQVGDQILVVRSSLLPGPIERGDIVVFSHPKYFPCRAPQDLLKRVVGLPGETIWSTGNTIYVDRHQLNERGWYNPTAGQVGSTPILRTKIPSGDYFMMGDNRTDSCDSRSFGAVSGSSIVGEVVAVVLRNGHPYFHLLSSAS
jgi:signal peptidase I